LDRGHWELLPHPKASTIATKSSERAGVYSLIGHRKTELVSALKRCRCYLKRSAAAISLVAASQVGIFVSFDEYYLSEAKVEVSMELSTLAIPMATLTASEHFRATATNLTIS
jgi:hypothetical protein